MSDEERPVAAELAERLASADGASATEAAVCEALGLRPRDVIADRALTDVVVGLVAALRAAGAGPEGQGTGAAISVAAFRAAQSGAEGWAPRDEIMAMVRDDLLEAAMPEAGGEAKLTPELAEAASRYLATTLFSQWELHRAVMRRGGGLPVREVAQETRIVDQPRRPPPLAAAAAPLAGGSDE